MSKNLGPRHEWTSGDDQILFNMWDETHSVFIISRIMKRSMSSIQTRASRLNLPSRDEASTKIRKKWKKVEEIQFQEWIEDAIKNHKSVIKIENMAKVLNRTVDALVKKIASKYGEDSDVFKKIEIGHYDVNVIKKTVPQIKRETGKLKTCLKCRKTFWSEGNHNWICQNCKRSDEWD